MLDQSNALYGVAYYMLIFTLTATRARCADVLLLLSTLSMVLSGKCSADFLIYLSPLKHYRKDRILTAFVFSIVRLLIVRFVRNFERHMRGMLFNVFYQYWDVRILFDRCLERGG